MTMPVGRDDREVCRAIDDPAAEAAFNEQTDTSPYLQGIAENRTTRWERDRRDVAGRSGVGREVGGRSWRRAAAPHHAGSAQKRTWLSPHGVELPLGVGLPFPRGDAGTSESGGLRASDRGLVCGRHARRRTAIL